MASASGRAMGWLFVFAIATTRSALAADEPAQPAAATGRSVCFGRLPHRRLPPRMLAPRLAAIRVEGSMDARRLRSVLVRHLRELRACYELSRRAALWRYPRPEDGEAVLIRYPLSLRGR